MIECKRPLSWRGVPANLHRARSQLLEHLKGVPPGARGVVAISLSKAMNRGEKLLGFDSEEAGRRGLEQQVTEAAERFYEVWGTFGQEIVGLIFHVITPALDRRNNMYVVAQQLEGRSLRDEGGTDHPAFLALGRQLEAIRF